MVQMLGYGAGGLVILIVAVLLIAFAVEQSNRSRDARRRPSSGRMIDVGGGRELYIDGMGSNGPTVVLETGKGGPSILVAPLQERIAAFTRVCRYDRANIGFSDPAPSGRTFEDYANDLDTLLTNAGETGPYILVGESFGGLLVRAYAHAHPDKVAGIVLVDAAEEQLVRERLLPIAKSLAGGLRAIGLASNFGVLRLALPRAGKMRRLFSRAQLETLASHMSRASHWRDAADWAAYERMPAEGYPSLGDIPLTVIRHGEPFTGVEAPLEEGWTEAQARLAALSRHSAVIHAEHNGHTIAEQNPALVAEAVRALVEQLRSARIAAE